MLTLHHLETSRSTRVLWLLEALGVEYTLVSHRRGPDMRAGADLKAVHPLGKAPTIVDGDLVLTESSAILRYITHRYGNDRFVPPAGTDAHARHDEWLDFAEGSMSLPLMLTLLGMMAGGLPAALAGFATSGLDQALDHVTAEVEDRRFLLGDELTLADMQMSYGLALAEAAGLIGERPALSAYWQRLQGDEGYRRAIEIGGPMAPSLSR